MKLTQKKIKEVISEILGSDDLEIIKELKGKQNISEFVLATKLKKDIKVIRHLLYKLHNNNLVSSIRKKDKQKGWYIYYWTLILDNIKYLYIKNKKIQLDLLKKKIEKEEKEPFFVCSKQCVRLDFDQSLDFEFRCPECGELISQDDKKIGEIKKKIEILEKELEATKEKQTVPNKKIIKKKIGKKKIGKKSNKKQTVPNKKIIKKKIDKKKIGKKSNKKQTVKNKKIIKKKIGKKKIKGKQGVKKEKTVKEKTVKKKIGKKSNKKQTIQNKKTIKKKK